MLTATVAVQAAPSQADSTDPAKRARDQFDQNAQAMGTVKIPMATEPAFHFKA